MKVSPAIRKAKKTAERRPSRTRVATRTTRAMKLKLRNPRCRCSSWMNDRPARNALIPRCEA